MKQIFSMTLIWYIENFLRFKKAYSIYHVHSIPGIIID